MKALFKEPRPRRKSDFYPTRDPHAVAVLNPLTVGWPQDVWEPAAGEGDLVRALEDIGLRVTATDLEDYDGGGLGGLDFLKFERPLAPAIITNPPFSLASEFIDHALGKLGVRYLALLLKSDFWCAASRLPLWAKYPPSLIAYMCWRVDFTGDGAAPMTTAWHIWTPDHVGPTAVCLLGRPDR